jgi:hypothetical protein
MIKYTAPYHGIYYAFKIEGWILVCRDISIEIDDGSAMVNAMGAQKAKDYKCLW